MTFGPIPLKQRVVLKKPNSTIVLGYYRPEPLLINLLSTFDTWEADFPSIILVIIDEAMDPDQGQTLPDLILDQERILRLHLRNLQGRERSR